MNQSINQNNDNDRKMQDTMHINSEMQFKKKKADNTIEELEEFTGTPPSKDIEYFTE